MKGVSVLYAHPPFHVPEGVVVDVLHFLYLGIVLKLLTFWFSKDHRGKPFNIHSKVSQMCSVW